MRKWRFDISYNFLFYRHTNCYVSDIDILCVWECEVYLCNKSRYSCNEEEANLISKSARREKERINKIQNYDKYFKTQIKSSSTRVSLKNITIYSKKNSTLLYYTIYAFRATPSFPCCYLWYLKFGFVKNVALSVIEETDGKLTVDV